MKIWSELVTSQLENREQFCDIMLDIVSFTIMLYGANG